MSLKKSVGVKDLPFMDVKLSFEERACDLVSRMSLEEKLTQLAAVTTAEIPHLGVSEYKWWGEALHGISRMPDSDDPKFEKYEQKQTASSFPIDLSMGSTWNKDLVHRLATVIGDEGRAFANEDPSNVMGLTFWSPTINLMRDPRWGRAEENYSEDAFLTSEIAGEFVRGMQGDDEKYLKVASTLKHFAANNSEVNRHSGSSDCDDRTLREFYMRAFKDITEKHHPECVMTSYNRINDIPMSVNTYMLDTILRRTWGFNGHVVTDCGGLGNIINEHQHNWKPNGHEGKYKGKEVAADAMKAGVDINCGYVYRTFTSAAVASGLLPEEVLDKTVVRLFTTRMRTGEFDPAEIMPYSVVNGYSKNAKIRRPHSALLSEKVSDQSVVLIKNEPNSQGDKLLPIDTNKYKNILIMGEQYGKVLLGGYSNAWQQCYEELSVSPLSALKKMGVNYKEIENPSYDYLKDIRNITLTKSNGDKIVLNGTNGENKGCLSKKGDEFVDILPNGLALIAFPGVDMNDTTKFEIEMRGSSKTLVDFMFDDRNQVPTFSVISDDDTNGEYKTYTLDFVKNPPRRALDRVVTLYLRVYDHRTTEERILVLSDEDRQKIKEADIILAFVGHQNGAGDDCDEERDLASFKMPRKQDSLLLQLLELNENVVAYMQGSQVDLRPVENKLKAITWCCYN
ncbi:MAG: glycoside hydrolase family 3 N-terminal domain-containing protein, partial [Clostridia bacterium]